MRRRNNIIDPVAMLSEESAQGNGACVTTHRTTRRMAMASEMMAYMATMYMRMCR
ncbi:MAG: hypothetical protein IJD53_03985 [Alistipes sp.]|nr:hypothetical protein [Alistipes sp.]